MPPLELVAVKSNLAWSVAVAVFQVGRLIA